MSCLLFCLVFDNLRFLLCSLVSSFIYVCSSLVSSSIYPRLSLCSLLSSPRSRRAFQVMNIIPQGELTIIELQVYLPYSLKPPSGVIRVFRSRLFRCSDMEICMCQEIVPKDILLDCGPRPSVQTLADRGAAITFLDFVCVCVCMCFVIVCVRLYVLRLVPAHHHPFLRSLPMLQVPIFGVCC